MLSPISLVDVKSSGSLKQAIGKSLELVEFEFPHDIKNVVIKPNLCFYWDYSTGETTDPKFVEALIDLIHTKISSKVEIFVVEADASAMKCEHAFKFLGYKKMTRNKRVHLVNLSEEDGERVKVPIGSQILNFTVPQIIQNADLRINVPKIKYHPLTKLSCALKNIYGCNPYPKKFRYHTKINEVIVGLNKAMKFDLCIVDGIIARGSIPCRLNLVMTSSDAVAIDTVVAKLLHINPKHISHIVLANKEGIGNTSFVTRGASLGIFKKRYPRKTAKSEIMQLGYKLVIKLGLSDRLGLS